MQTKTIILTAVITAVSLVIVALIAYGSVWLAAADRYVALYADSPSIYPGEDVKRITLTWDTAGVRSCTASGGWTGEKDISGAEFLPVPTEDTIYSLECRDLFGRKAKSSTVLTVDRSQVGNWNEQGISFPYEYEEIFDRSLHTIVTGKAAEVDNPNKRFSLRFDTANGERGGATYYVNYDTATKYFRCGEPIVALEIREGGTYTVSTNEYYYADGIDERNDC